MMTVGLKNVSDVMDALERRAVRPGIAPTDHRYAWLGALIGSRAPADKLRACYDQCLAAGDPFAVLDAIVQHAVGYVGVSGVAPARDALAELRLRLGAVDGEDYAATAPSAEEIRAQGMNLYDKFDPGREARQARFFADIDPYWQDAMYLAGLVLSSDQISLRSRQIVTIAILASLGGQGDQLRFHMKVGYRNGVSLETMSGILSVVQIWAGLPRANSAASQLVDAIHEADLRTSGREPHGLIKPS